MDKPIGRCNTCGELFESVMIEKNCPWCNSSIDYVQGKSKVIDYFVANLPKLNNPLDFSFPNKVIKPIFNKNELNDIHYLNVIGLRTNYNGTLIKLALTWDDNYKKVYAIYEDVNNLGNFYLSDISLENFNSLNSDVYCTVFRVPMPKEAYDKFNSILRDGNNSLGLSNYFQVYNSIRWDIIDPFCTEMAIHKTFYEYASINYLLHLFLLMKIPELFEDFDSTLIDFNTLGTHQLFYNYEVYDLPFKDFLEKVTTKEGYLQESLEFLSKNNIYDYNDVFDYYMQEGSVAPVASPLSPVITRSTEVYNKLYDLGYNPSMNIYSNEGRTFLCPTIKTGNSYCYLECNNNLMKGINEIDNEIDIKNIFDELYELEESHSIFISIKKIPSDVMRYNVLQSTSNDDFIKRILNLRDQFDKPNYNYEEDVYDQIEQDKSILNKFRKLEINSSSLFRYGHTFYRLKNLQWSGTKFGYMYLDENNNIASYIIMESIQNDYNIYSSISKEIINEITTIEVSSQYKNDDLDIEMIKSLTKEKKIDTIRVRDFRLLNKLEISNEFTLIGNDKGTRIFKIGFNTLNESLILNEASSINPSKRKKIEDLIYKVFDKLDTTGANTKKYKNLFNGMSDEKFNSYMKEFLNNPKRNFYLECLPNKNAPKIKNAVDALNVLKVPTEEYLYYRHDAHKDDPIRTMYKVPILYINVRRLRVKLNYIREQALVA